MLKELLELKGSFRQLKVVNFDEDDKVLTGFDALIFLEEICPSLPEGCGNHEFSVTVKLKDGTMLHGRTHWTISHGYCEFTVLRYDVISIDDLFRRYQESEEKLYNWYLEEYKKYREILNIFE